MIDSRVIQLLGSADPEKRKKAVMLLAKTKDREALPHLEKVNSSDHNREVRSLATKAIAYIEKHTPVSSPISDDVYDDYDEGDDNPDSYYASPFYAGDDDEPEYETVSEDEEEDEEEVFFSASTEIRVSDAAAASARSMVQQAMDWSLRANNDRAAQLLGKALRLDPRLVHDSYTRSLAGSVVGLDNEAAIRQLIKASARSKSGDGGSWAGALADLALYGLIVGVGTFVFLVLLMRYMAPLAGVDVGDEILTQFLTASYGTFATTAVAYGVWSIITLLLVGVLIHFAAASLMSGQGTYKRLIRGITPFSSIATLGLYALWGIVLYTAPPLPEMTFASASLTDVETFMMALVESSGPVVTLLSLGTLALTVGMSVYYGKLVGSAYDFGMLRGCGAFFLGMVLLFVVSFMLGCFLSILLPSLTLGAL
jgi:hypothetical protein